MIDLLRQDRQANIKYVDQMQSRVSEEMNRLTESVRKDVFEIFSQVPTDSKGYEHELDSLRSQLREIKLQKTQESF